MCNQFEMAPRTSIRFFDHWEGDAIASIDNWSESCPLPENGDTIRIGSSNRYRICNSDFSIGEGINLVDFMVMELPYNDPEDAVE